MRQAGNQRSASTDREKASTNSQGTGMSGVSKCPSIPNNTWQKHFFSVVFVIVVIDEDDQTVIGDIVVQRGAGVSEV